jgi:hypothetical protein
MSESSAASSVREYRDLIIEWDRIVDEDHRRGNRLFDRYTRIGRELVESKAGREAVASLLDDVDSTVRLTAATLLYDSLPNARFVLEEIANDDEDENAASAAIVIQERSR